MHIYNWYHSTLQAFIMYTIQIQWVQSDPLASFAPLFSIPFCSPFVSPYLLGTLLAVTGSVHLVPRLHVNWSSYFPPLFHIPPIPKSRPRGFPDPNKHSLGWHRESGSQDRAQLAISYLTKSKGHFGPINVQGVFTWHPEDSALYLQLLNFPPFTPHLSPDWL